ncbi:MAG: glycoside hydrolase family 2 TIM barrel-domain containing protein [Verrucomicrobiae bacterium]|nr:glycoside hydrolase family 2 TIM barrel-domain containing protein [Verrucomicrobiae bacterium]
MKTIERSLHFAMRLGGSVCGGAEGNRAWLALLICGTLAVNGGWAAHAAEPVKTGGPVKVQLLQTNGGYQLYVDHTPFYIKGAGLETGNQEQLAEHGGNSIRTWSTEDGRTRQLLDRALTNRLYVTLGLRLGLERQGFDYNDKAAVARQLAGVKQEVLKYKDHPALIIWAIGNELNLNAKNPKVWDAVNDISKMIHQTDPNHLTTTPLAGFNQEVVQEVKSRAPDLDLISFQMYADIVNLPRYLREAGWQGAYLVTEWGATGHWEVRKTAWGAPIEDNSTGKAESYKRRFETVIEADSKQCVGSYVFLWGHKQERTPTWYGMFLDSGEETPAVDVMQYLWTGAWPAIRCPQLKGAWLNGKTAYQNIHLQAGQSYPARVQANAGDNKNLTFVWDVMPESTDLKTGGDFEAKPESVQDLIEEATGGEITMKAPPKPGAYRLFAYVFDGKGHAAHVNIPFFVDEAGTSPMAQARRTESSKE